MICYNCRYFLNNYQKPYFINFFQHPVQLGGWLWFSTVSCPKTLVYLLFLIFCLGWGKSPPPLRKISADVIWNIWKGEERKNRRVGSVKGKGGKTKDKWEIEMKWVNKHNRSRNKAKRCVRVKFDYVGRRAGDIYDFGPLETIYNFLLTRRTAAAGHALPPQPRPLPHREEEGGQPRPREGSIST